MKAFNIEDLKKLIQRMEKKSKNIGEIINPFITDNLSKQKRIELCQVGKFLSLLDKSSKIIERSESPDFIISYNNCRIGLEHTIIVNKDNVSYEKSVTNLFNDAAKVFSSKHPHINIHVNVWLNENKLSFGKADSKLLKHEIADYIYSVYIGAETKKPKFIKTESIMKHSRVAFIYNSGAHCVQYLDDIRLREAIKKKERLIQEYIINSCTEKQWLLIVIGSPTPESFEYNDLSHFKIESKFDHIFLLEDFSEKLCQIK